MKNIEHHLASNKINVQVLQDYSYDYLDSLYQQVFADHYTCHFFLSKYWMYPWLKRTNPKPLLFIFSDTAAIVGFAFVGVKCGALGNTYFLNQSGNTSQDQIWIEYNDIISSESHLACRYALLSHLSNQPKAFKLICNNAIHNGWSTPQWRTWSEQSIIGYKSVVDDRAVASGFSKNTKSQISRARNYITKTYGPIQLKVIETKELDSSLDELSRLHIKHWRNHPLGSGFDNEAFVDFHKNINSNYLNKKTAILKFTSHDTLLGYLYFFIDKQQVYFYLSAINYIDKHNNYKPGMVMHTMAMEHFATLNYLVYDFLAGDARYKTSLSNETYSFFTLHLYSNKWYYRIIKLAVRFKRCMKQAFSRK